MKGDENELEAARRRRSVADVPLFDTGAGDDMIRQPVASSNIAELAYSAQRLELEVTFNSGATWRYLGVSPSEYRDLATAPSIGSHFHRYIKAVKSASQVS